MLKITFCVLNLNHQYHLSLALERISYVKLSNVFSKFIAYFIVISFEFLFFWSSVGTTLTYLFYFLVSTLHIISIVSDSFYICIAYYSTKEIHIFNLLIFRFK